MENLWREVKVHVAQRQPQNITALEKIRTCRNTSYSVFKRCEDLQETCDLSLPTRVTSSIEVNLCDGSNSITNSNANNNKMQPASKKRMHEF